MKVTTIVNGITQLVITPENDLEKEIIKMMAGATATLVSENNNILNNNIGGSLLLRKEKQND